MNAKPVEIKPDMFFGQVQTKANETVFCHVQKMTTDAESYWSLYRRSATEMSNSSRGILSGLAKRIIKATRADGSVSYNTDDFYDRYNASYLGFSSRANFQQLVDSMGEKGFTKGSKKINAITNCAGGEAGLCLSATGYTYVAYLSKTPNFSILEKPNYVEYANRCMTLQEYITHYSDLLMCVGVHMHPGFNNYHVRGIFRNPYSFLEGTYKDISMILHGFVGAVACEYFPDKRKERVSPLISQLYIMCRELKSEDVLLPEGYDYEEILAEGFPSEDCDVHANVYIKVEALRDYYLTTGVSPKCQVGKYKSELNQSIQTEEEKRERKPSF